MDEPIEKNNIITTKDRILKVIILIVIIILNYSNRNIHAYIGNHLPYCLLKFELLMIK